MKNPKFSHTFEVVSQLPTALGPLVELAKNFRWTWNGAAQDLFRSIDKELWEETEHNPVEMLMNIRPERIERVVADPLILKKIQICFDDLAEYMTAPTWFEKTYPDQVNDTKIAYFCAEFGISESLPIYSGGLGILAGDHLKAASDLGIPLVGVGLLYSKGYFRQRLNHDGWQIENYPRYDFYKFPIDLVRDDEGRPVRVHVEFPDRTVTCQIWKAQVGRIPLYLLDSNVLENAPSDQGITDTLYGGDEEMRIRQEMILGIGGMKALKAVGISPTVCHMNEGHAAFLSVERIRQFMEEHHTDYKIARQVVVAGNVFTTHTPVPAGFDLFNPPLLERYIGKSIQAIGLGFDDFLKLGRIEPENGGEAFNMAVLAMENANYVNGVSKLHAAVTRTMFSSRWPNYPENEVPVDAVTNGIHTMTWVSETMGVLFDEYLGDHWRRSPQDPESWANVDQIPDDELWAVREELRASLVRFVRRRLQRDLERRHVGRADFDMAAQVFDPRILTIGFARRFATYKRASLMLTDRERLKSILFHPERPVQIVLAGKSHPRDDGGKRIIQDLVHFINNEGGRARMVFVEDYDMEVARHLVQGVDLWLNNPRRPLEASGTSGMKVVPNGGLNCSILDGWWDEGYDPSLGFSIGDGVEENDLGHQDWLDSRSLYSLIEHEIAPKFYHRVDRGVPTSWTSMIKKSIQNLAPMFSTSRMVSDYTRKAYVPASLGYQALSANHQAAAIEARKWRERVRANWPTIHLVDVSDNASAQVHPGEKMKITVRADLGNLCHDDVVVEAVIGQVGSGRELVSTRTVELSLVGDDAGIRTFEGEFSTGLSGYHGYTARIKPSHKLVSVAHELPLVLWESAD